MRFEYHKGQLAGRNDVLCVDGVFDCGRNLSHWPGNRTPSPLRHDLSTGMALKLAAHVDRERFLDGISIVSNNHYDTDGLCALFAALHPETALVLAPALLRAAAAGDFEQVEDWKALAFDQIVMNIGSHPRSPLAQKVAGVDSDTRHEICYTWLLEHLPDLLGDPGTLEPLWREALDAFDLDRHDFEMGAAWVEWRPAVQMAIVRSRRELSTAALVTHSNRLCDAGDRWGRVARILSIVETWDGFRYRFLHSTHSWFDMTSSVPRRFDLAKVSEALQRQECSDRGRWIAEDLTMPLCDLVFGQKRPRDRVIDSVAIPADSRTAPVAVIETLEAAAADADATEAAG